jgi:quercetin dioxygenase-like cupin family protein
MVNPAGRTGTIFWCAATTHARATQTAVNRPIANEVHAVMSYLVDFDELPRIDVWGETVRARAVDGARCSLALVELAPGALVPEHRHHNEQMGTVLHGSITFTVDDETRTLTRGGTWRIPSDHPHHAVAGPDGALVIDIFSPTREDWDTLPHGDPHPVPWPDR